MRSIYRRCIESITPGILFSALIISCICAFSPSSAQAGKNYSHPDFSKSSLDSSTIAIGGLILKNGNSIDKYSGIDISLGDFSFNDQSESWSHSLNTLLLDLNRNIEIKPFYRTQIQTPTDLRQQTHATIACYSSLKPKLLTAWAEALPQTDYLLLAGIARSWVNRPTEKGKTWSRVIWVTVEIFDLKKKYKVYEHTNKIRVHAPNLRGLKTTPNCQVNPVSGVVEVPNNSGPNVPTIQQALSASLGNISKKLWTPKFSEVGSPVNEDDFDF